MNQKDKAETKEIVIEAMTSVLMPVLDTILVKLDEHSAILGSHSAILSGHSQDISGLKEDLEDVQLTVNRIEMFQRAEQNRADDNEIRITKLEKVRQ